MSIYKDEGGRWHGYVSMGLTDNGRRDRRHVSGERRAAVVAKVRDLERRRDEGVAGAAGRAPTVAQWLEHWLVSVAGPRLRPSTRVRYRLAVEQHLGPKVGHHRLDRLQPEHLEASYAALLAQGLSPATVLYAHRVLSRSLKVATQRGRVVRNVATLVDAPSVQRVEVEPLTPGEARRLLEAAEPLRNGSRWSVALALGLRQGEALGLCWDAVDLVAGALTVRQALQREKGRGLVLVPPKSAAGRRTIALPPQLSDVLRAHRTTQLEERLRAGSDRDFVFAQPNGRPIDPRRDWHDWKALLTAAGVRDARLHDARHTAATLLLTQGAPGLG